MAEDEAAGDVVKRVETLEKDAVKRPEFDESKQETDSRIDDNEDRVEVVTDLSIAALALVALVFIVLIIVIVYLTVRQRKRAGDWKLYGEA